MDLCPQNIKRRNLCICICGGDRDLATELKHRDELPGALPSGGSRSVRLSHFPYVRLCNPVAAARQAPLSLGFSRQGDWSGLPCPPPGHLPNPGIEPTSLCLLHWQVGSLPNFWTNLCCSLSTLFFFPQGKELFFLSTLYFGIALYLQKNYKSRDGDPSLIFHIKMMLLEHQNQKIKILEINLTRDVQYWYIENYKWLLREI